MNKEEYVANMRAMVKKYVERAEDSVTNPPTKRVCIHFFMVWANKSLCRWCGEIIK